MRVLHADRVAKRSDYAAAGIPRFRPDANPRAVVRLALLAMFAGTVVLLAAIDEDASAEIVTLPLLLLGLGIGGLASQLGSVTVSAVPDELSPEVGGLQNTATNIGASLGTALAGSVLIASLTATIVAGIQENPAVPPDVREQAVAIVDENATARLRALRAALAIIAIIAAAALFFSATIPTRQPRSRGADTGRGPPDLDPVVP